MDAITTPTSNISIADIRFLISSQHGDGTVSFRRQHIHQGVTVLVERHAGAGLEQLSVQGGEDADVVVGAGGGANNASVLVNGLQELTNHKRDRLNPLDLFLNNKDNGK